jgi:hypothetical protein
MKRFVILCILMISFFNIGLWAQTGPNEFNDSLSVHKVSLTEKDKKQINLLPKLHLTQNLRAFALPLFVNNSQQIYFPWPFYQIGLECGQSTSITQIFSYETCLKRGWTDINYNNDHRFPSHFVWNFCNDGINDGVLFLESWHVVKSAGTPNITDWGGNPYGGQHSRWITGYDKYYRAMHNRISEVCAIPTDTEEGILTLKHWIHNHLEGKSVGGLANFNATFKFPDAQIPLGFPGAGKTIITTFTNEPNHAYTLIGYNDTIGWDYNGDHQLTNHIDINNDGKVDIRDWEKGCFIITHTSGPDWGDFGETYLPYRIMATDYHQNGIWGTTAFVVLVKEEVKPQLTLKSSITHTKRNGLKISVGVALDTNASVPTYTYEPFIFQNQGGALFMQGGTTEADKTLEFGLDLSPLLNFIEPNTPVKFFYSVNETDPDGSGIGTINQFSMIDYTAETPIEIESGTINKTIVNNATTTQTIIHAVNFSKPIIIDSTLTCSMNEPILMNLQAVGGVPNYRWEFSKTYQVNQIQHNYPTGGTNIALSDIDNGFAVIDLPFRFTYFNEDFFKLVLFSNGYIAFAQQDNYPFMSNDLTKMQTTRMIAPFLADLKINSAKKIIENDQISIHVKAKISSQENSEISFCVSIDRAGNITFKYGNMKYNNTPFYAGISNGNLDQLVWAPINGKKDIDLRNTSWKFTPPKHIDNLHISQNGVLSGQLTETGTFPIDVTCFDNNDVKTSKQLIIQCSYPPQLTISHFYWNSEECHTIQRGSDQSIGFKVENFSTLSYQNCDLYYSVSNNYITIDDNYINLGSYSQNQYRDFLEGFTFWVNPNTPEHEMIDLRWCILSDGDTLSKGIFSFFVEDPDIEFIGYIIEKSAIETDPYLLQVDVKNINFCHSNNLTYAITLLGSGYAPTVSETPSAVISKFESQSILFNILDPKQLLANGEQKCRMDIFSHGIKFDEKEFTLYSDLTYLVNPNPSSDYIEVTPSNSMITISNIKIFNTKGSLVFESEYNQNQVIINIKHLSQGIYILKIESINSESKTLKIVKI